MGLAIAVVVNVLNPRLVIMTTEGLVAGPLGLDAMHESLDRALSGALESACVSSPNRWTNSSGHEVRPAP